VERRFESDRVTHISEVRVGKTAGLNVLVIGDAHASPSHSNRRFTWLGRMIADVKPDAVVDIGDFGSFDSLSWFDKGKTSFEGRRVCKDIDAVNDALEKLHDGMGKFKPKRLIRVGGNHDDERIEKAVQSASELEGFLSVDSMDFKARGWEVHRFLKPVTVNGVRFRHYVPKLGLRKAHSGDYALYHIMKQEHSSCVVGHSHRLQYATVTGGGKRFMSASVGCYFEHDEPWATEDDNASFWRGICVLRNVRGGLFDLETMTMDRIRQTYS
jgi:predicted phosphodiesterase